MHGIVHRGPPLEEQFAFLLDALLNDVDVKSLFFGMVLSPWSCLYEVPC